MICMHAFNDVGLDSKKTHVCRLHAETLIQQIEYCTFFLGTVAAGGIFAGTNPSYTAYELAHAVKTADIKFFVVQPDLLPNVLKAAQQTGIPESHIFVFNVHDEPVPLNLRSWKWLQSQGEADWERFDDDERCKNTIAARLFSSGTTGLPKALDMTHQNFIAQHTLVQEHKRRPFPIRRIVSNPVFHVSQVPRVRVSPLRGGYKSYVMRRFELVTWMRYIKRYQITEINMVPMMVVTILNSGNPLVNTDTFASVRSMSSGAGPLDSALQARFQKLLRPDAPFNQAWGMSETTCICTMFYYPEMDSSGGVGRMLPNHDAKVVDDDGNDVTAYGVVGELCVRGPCIVARYYGNVQATSECWDTEGYFHTGDMAYISEKNRSWYIVDRKKVKYPASTGSKNRY